MRIAIGCDHLGNALKERLKKRLAERDCEVSDLSAPGQEVVDYPAVGEAVALAVVEGRCEFGVLICGTGVRISLAANKIPGVRATVCSEPYTAKLSREHNDANILSLGARVVGEELAVMILDAFLDAEYEGGRHARRVAMIGDIERRHAARALS